MEQINVSVLGWTTDPLLLTHRRKYAYGRKYHLPIKTGYIFPFQLSRPAGFLNIANVTIVRDETGEETDITASMVQSGLRVAPSGNGQTDMIRYLGTMPLPGVWAEGLYYLKMSDAESLWFSDFFCFTDSIEEFVRLEWWHNSPMTYRDGVIDYTFPYKNYVYLKTDIGKPKYPSDELIDTREGREFAIRTTTWKEYQFTAIVPEYLTDVFRMIRQHDNQVVKSGDTVYECDLLKMNGEVEWIDAIFGSASFVFRTGTFVSVRSKPDSAAHNANPNNCVATKYTVNQTLTTDQFVDNINDLRAFGNAGEYIAINGLFDLGDGLQGSNNVHRIRNDGTIQLADSVEDDLYFDLNTMKYFVHRGDSFGYTLPQVISVVSDANPATTGTITAYVVTGATVEVMYRTPLNSFRSAGSFTAGQLKAGLNIDIENWEAIKLRFITTSCGFLQETSTFFLNLPDQNSLSGLDHNAVLDATEL